MSRSAYLFLEAEPFHSAAGALNAEVESGLRALGYAVERHNRHRLSPQDSGIPVANARRLLAVRSRPPADLAVFCDMGLGIHAPSRALARRTAVFFHGLHGAPTTWLGNPLVDLYGAFSPYMHDALGALLAMPDWRGRKCLDARGPLAVRSIVPVLPGLEAQDGDAQLSGGEWPASLHEALERGELLGHAIQPGKSNWQAVFAILLHLRALTRAGGHPPIRLVVAAQDFSTLQHALRFRSPFDPSMLAAGLQAASVGLEDLLLPVPPLSQAALFRLFREARFGLSYNTTPEPFGMYVLESVLNGCPVYTSGSGNNRHTLPPGHGIVVRESAAMAAGAPDAYASVAQQLLQDVLAPEPRRRECQQGAALLRRTFTREAFTASLQDCVAALEQEAAAPPWRFDDLVVRLSPMVRRLDPRTGRLNSDYMNVVLTPEERDALAGALGQPAGRLGRDEAGLACLESLTDKGVLALMPPESTAPPPPTVGAWPWYPPRSAFLSPSHLLDTPPESGDPAPR